MRFDRALILSPAYNTLYVVGALTVSFFAFAYSVKFGKLPILVMYAVWFLPLALEPRILTKNFAATVLVFALAGFALLSSVWSINPAATLRGGLQYGSTILCAVVAARIAGPRGLVVGALVACNAVLLYSTMFGYYDYDVIDGSYAFEGAFSSKNQLGFFASLAILFGLMAVFSRGAGVWIKGLAVGTVLFGAVLLKLCQSATSIATVGVTGGVVVGLFVARRISPTPRSIIVLLGMAFVAVLAVAAVQVGAFESFLGAFGKDSTLTGRTYLWSVGIETAREQPFVGLGYLAFWTQGYGPAEVLWEDFYIPARTGFHFHNSYIEAAVGLGLVGLGLLVATLLGFFAVSLGAVVAGSMSVEVIAAVTIGTLLALRSFVEIDFLTPYTVGTFLLYFSFVLMIDKVYAKAARQRLHRISSAVRRVRRPLSPLPAPAP